MNATLRPAIQEQPQLRQPKRVSETRPTQVSGGERAAQFTRKYESVFWASLAPQIEFETDESSPGTIPAEQLGMCVPPAIKDRGDLVVLCGD